MIDRAAAILNRLADRRTKLRRRLEEVFSRDVLGSVAVTASILKVIEKALAWEPYLLAGWVAVSTGAVLLFVHWEAAASAVDGAVDKAAEAAED